MRNRAWRKRGTLRFFGRELLHGCLTLVLQSYVLGASPNYQVQRRHASLSARGRGSARVPHYGSVARGRALYVSPPAATQSYTPQHNLSLLRCF
jgi:hypothetical protein